LTLDNAIPVEVQPEEEDTLLNEAQTSKASANSIKKKETKQADCFKL
jgi:hypothetical protein